MAHYQNPAAWQEAQRLIQEALEQGNSHLSLAGLRLRSLPEELLALSSQLVSLDLSNIPRLQQLPNLSAFSHLQSLDLSDCDSIASLEGLRHLTQLQSLNLSFCSALTSLEALQHLTQLQSLNLRFCHALTSLEGLQHLTQLQSLNLCFCFALTALEALQHLTQLQALEFSYSRALTSLEELQHLTQLQSLDLSHCDALTSLEGLQHLTHLQSINLPGCDALTSLEGLQHLTQLQSLDLSHCDALASLKGLQHLTQLHSLDLSHCDALASLKGLQHLTQLQSLNLSFCSALATLEGLQNLTQLQSIELSHCNALASLEGLQHLTQLQSLNLSFCSALTSLEGLQHLTQLQSINLSHCDALASLDELKHLTHLQSLSIRFCGVLTSLKGLQHLSQLQSLNLRWSRDLNSLEGLQHLTKLQSLELSNSGALSSLEELQHLTQLKMLYLRGCGALTSLKGLQHLAQLKILHLSDCDVLTTLEGLQYLTQLKTFHLSDCGVLTTLEGLQYLTQLRRLQLPECSAYAAIQDGSELIDTLDIQMLLLTQMPYLRYFESVQATRYLPSVPPEMLGEDVPFLIVENWYDDLLQSGACTPRELKLMLLGNGRIGKTQLARRLQSLPFDATLPSTHGIHLHHWQQQREGQLPIDIQCWDFGGQDVYLGTHSLFIDQRALYLLLWHPDFENSDLVSCEKLQIHNRPLSYWLAYLHSLAGTQAQILIAQSQCDQPAQERKAPTPTPQPFTYLKENHLSAKEPDGLETFLPQLNRAMQLQLERNGKVQIPASWLNVAEQLRELFSERVCSHEKFLALCKESAISAPQTLLTYLHQSGRVFFHKGCFNDQLILDQAWALQGVYLLLERQEVLPTLKSQGGYFTHQFMQSLLWQHGSSYTQAEQNLFLEMMQQCGVCFQVAPDQYLATDCLPERNQVELEIARDWRDATADVHIRLHYDFLHDGTMRHLLSRIGDKVKAIATYWRYGCCYYDSEHRTSVLFKCEKESSTDQFANYGQPGYLDIQLCGPGAQLVANHLIESITATHHLGQQPRIAWLLGNPDTEEKRDLMTIPKEPFSQLNMGTVQPGKAEVYFSYAWGNDGELHQETCNQLLNELRQHADLIDPHIDKQDLGLGDSIENFELKLARAPYIVVILSQKYLHSPQCMKELRLIYEQVQKERERFVEKIIPVVLPDAHIDSLKDRLLVVQRWSTEKSVIDQLIENIGSEAAGSACKEQQDLRAIVNCCTDVLKWFSDTITNRQDHAKGALELLLKRLQKSLV
jgi:internalin A